MAENKVVSNKHTFVSREVSRCAHHTKSIGRQKFNDEYFPKIHQAIERVKGFATELPDVLDNVGTNLPELLNLLGFGIS